MKDILLLADSNYITWAPSIPCCLLLRLRVSRLGILQTLPSKNQRTSELSFAESKCADTGTNDSGILQRSLRSVEPVFFPASHRALSHMKPRGSLARLFLPKVKHYLRAAPTLKFYIRRIDEAFCLPGGEYSFSNKNVFEKV